MTSLALNYLINLLARRDYSQFEIRQKMHEKAFSDTEIEQALNHCIQKNWQSDLRFASNYLRSRAQRGYGPLRISQELCQLKGVDDEIIEQAMAEHEQDWSEIALAQLRKKFPDFAEKQELKMKQKIFRYMLSHGFSIDDFAHYVGKGDMEVEF